MNSPRKTPNHTSTRVKPPYSPRIVRLLRSHVDAGLRTLVDSDDGVNFEIFCDTIIDAFPEKYYAEEWVQYWGYWKKRFQAYQKSEKKKRMEIFLECIYDCKAK